jgi:hypothetical protein
MFEHFYQVKYCGMNHRRLKFQTFNSTRHHHHICQDANRIKDVYHIKCNVPDQRKYKHQLLTEIRPDIKLPCYFDLYK